MSETPTRTTFRPRRPRANSVKLVSLLQRPPRSASVGSGAQKWPGAVMNDQKPVVHHTVHGTYGTPRGWYAYGVRTVAQQCHVPQVRTLRRRPVRTLRRPRGVRVSLARSHCGSRPLPLRSVPSRRTAGRSSRSVTPRSTSSTSHGRSASTRSRSFAATATRCTHSSPRGNVAGAPRRCKRSLGCSERTE